MSAWKRLPQLNEEVQTKTKITRRENKQEIKCYPKAIPKFPREGGGEGGEGVEV